MAWPETTHRSGHSFDPSADLVETEAHRQTGQEAEVARESSLDPRAVLPAARVARVETVPEPRAVALGAALAVDLAQQTTQQPEELAVAVGPSGGLRLEAWAASLQVETDHLVQLRPWGRLRELLDLAEELPATLGSLETGPMGLPTELAAAAVALLPTETTPETARTAARGS
jgi:hypothetical protein